MDETYVWKLMAKGMAKDATPEELKKLQELFKEDPGLQQAYFYLQKLQVQSGKELHPTEEEKQMKANGLQKIERMLSFDLPEETTKMKPIRRRRKYKRILIAASVLLIAGIAAFFSLLQPDTRSGKPVALANNQTETFTASRATSIELEDGTKVWLNRGSTLKCHKEFNKKNREVTLTGEGFFDVAKNITHPFIVHLKSGINVKVLGTRFNVKAYSNTPIIETSLLSGKIVLDLNKPGSKRIIMQPNEKITINVNDLGAVSRISHSEEKVIRKVRIRPNPADHKIPETAWMEDRLSFYDMPFEELSYELERIYGKEIIFKDSKLKEYHLTGSFKDESLNQVLKALQITTPFDYKIMRQKIILYKP